MNKGINLFYHLPKELSLDAFLMWLMIFIERNEAADEASQIFFDTLVLKPEDRGKKITHLEASRKSQVWENSTDIVLKFNLDGEPCTVLLETKISSPTALKSYQSFYTNIYRVIYVKLDHLEHQETLLAHKRGYFIVNTEMLLAGLEPLFKFSSIIAHYGEYLYDNYRLMAKKAVGDDFNSDHLYRLRAKYLRFLVR